ncbi:MAG: cobaltochelatase subunit CobN [Alphaproteobacteria bacterium]
MHLLSAIPGSIDDGSEAYDLQQNCSDIVILTFADTEISCLAQAQQNLLDKYNNIPSVCVANIMFMKHPYSVDLYLEKTASKAKIIVARLLGGKGYFEYGVEQLSEIAKKNDIKLVLLPGDSNFDAELFNLSNVEKEIYINLWTYFVEGGVGNKENFLINLSSIINNHYTDYISAQPLLKSGIYYKSNQYSNANDIPSFDTNNKSVAIVFYRALMQSANTDVIDVLCDNLEKQGLNAVPIYTSSLKDDVSAKIVQDILLDIDAHLILNGTGFAIKSPSGNNKIYSPYDIIDSPVFQIIFAGLSKQAWQDNINGLSPQDVAMNVALPEVDGRVITRAVSFKNSAHKDKNIQADIVKYEPVQEHCSWVARLARKYINLKIKNNKDKIISIVFANYPNKDSRIANGVGLDTPAGCLNILNSLQEQGYNIQHNFKNGNDLINYVKASKTNADNDKTSDVVLSVDEYEKYLQDFDKNSLELINKQWGSYENDPFYDKCKKHFNLPLVKLNNLYLGIQPARGYNIDPVKTYHDADLIPPHGYLAFYAFLQSRIDALIHMGKHGNLEWLPGKANALSDSCFPNCVLGAIPHFYPFIVNDPGEGTQAKRRTHSVIIDHLTPPLTRAETYGDMKNLERLIDELFNASTMDTRRTNILKQDIFDLAYKSGISKEIGLSDKVLNDNNLEKLDAYLCELKELQIRDGLHIFGTSPTGNQRRDLLIALTRVVRNDGNGKNASLVQSIANDFGINIDPLECEMGKEYNGKKPIELQYAKLGNWRTNGDTVERIEQYAMDLLDNKVKVCGVKTNIVYDEINTNISKLIDSCGGNEINSLLHGLNGGFVKSGSSGAPTRGRIDVLPTGKNFYSVDTRVLPTQSAWKLGWKSAQMVIDRYVSDNGEYPTNMAVSAWGTANMRTGGDDIAQVLSLIGAKPVWDNTTGKVKGFEILPVSVLGRPRVDVVLRVSGFFRDAFSGLMDLVDSVVRKVATLDESYFDNPIKQRFDKDLEKYADYENPELLAGARVFGSKPGAYGAGMQALMDEGIWESDLDLAQTYIEWGAYAYGGGLDGYYNKDVFIHRLRSVQAVLHNQDNREHDILDSDDYYQFQGGMASAVRHYSGKNPILYHNDHSRIENPKVRTLNEEISRIVRARASNPKWINSIMKHGYKGAFEISATVDYLYAFSATAKVVDNHHFEQLFDAYIENETVRNFLIENNFQAYQDILNKFQDAINRGLWDRQLKNSTQQLLESLLGESNEL